MLSRNLTDLVKFLACIMIALHHFSQTMVVAGTSNIIYQLFSTQGGWLGVAIFFFLSGYGLMKSDMKNHLSLLPFMQKRLMKTYLPAVLVSALWAGNQTIIGNKPADIQLFRLIFWNFNDEVLWFVRVIIVLYLLFAAYAWVKNRSLISKGFWFHRFLLAVMIPASMWLTHTGFVHGLSVGLFFVGVMLAEIERQSRWKTIGMIACAVLFSVVCTYILNYGAGIRIADWVHLLVNVCFIVIFLLLVGTKFIISVPELPKWLGGCSYDIYLVHNKALMLLRAC